MSRLRVARWWPSEIELRAPRGLLEWLICNPPNSGANRQSLPERRIELLEGSADARDEALRLVREGHELRGWHVLEGPSQPDVYLETAEAVIVIEGKRTERSPTTSTTWMPVRHQMLRHMDAAWDVRGNRPVLGFFIVEEEEPGSVGAPSPRWRDAAEATIAEDALTKSLPHRTADERSMIASGFLGVTTWRALRNEFQIPAECLIETVQ